MFIIFFLTSFISGLNRFITSGIGHLVDTLLVHNASRIKAMNTLGCDRMQLNLLVLQQNLKNIEPAVALVRSAHYFDLFAAGPDAIIALTKAAREARGANGSNGTSGANGVNGGSGADGGAAGGGGAAAAAASTTTTPTTTATATSGSGQESSTADASSSSINNNNNNNNKEAAAAAMAAPMGTDLPFSHVQLKFLVELCYSESLSSDRRDAAMQANRALNDHLLQLSGYTLQS
jgi:exocyst complex component 4